MIVFPILKAVHLHRSVHPIPTSGVLEGQISAKAAKFLTFSRFVILPELLATLPSKFPMVAVALMPAQVEAVPLLHVVGVLPAVQLPALAVRWFV